MNPECPRFLLRDLRGNEMAEDLDVFLQAIGNPANFSLKLLVQLSKVLVSEDGADKQGKYRLKAEDKENAPSRPTGRSGRAVGQKKDKSNLDSGLRALKTIQQLTKITLPAVQTLLKEARIRSDTEGDKHNFPSDSMKYIIKCTQKAIETLEGHEHELGLKPLDMEKALANLISRFVEVNEHETAVDLILYLLQRLSAPKLLLKSAGTKKTKSKLALGVSSGTAFRQKAMKALVFSSKTDIKSVTKVSLVMALLTNSLRCWLDALNFVEEVCRFVVRYLISATYLQSRFRSSRKHSLKRMGFSNGACT